MGNHCNAYDMDKSIIVFDCISFGIRKIILVIHCNTYEVEIITEVFDRISFEIRRTTMRNHYNTYVL